MSKSLELTGTVEDVFGHRFTLKTPEGKQLIDLGPDAGDVAKLQPGQKIGVKGDQKPSEVKAQSIRIADGEWQEIKSDRESERAEKEHQVKEDKNAPEIDDAHVTKLLDEGGYTDHGERTRKPKHVEVIASKDGKRHKVHVHKDGVKKSEIVG